jgi:DNA mismatch repair protein MutH
MPPPRRPIPRSSTFCSAVDDTADRLEQPVDTEARLVKDSFDYRTASEEEILAKAAELEGRLLGSIPGARFSAATGGTGRAEVGHAIESHFGIPKNPSPLPDFPEAAIELKTLPLRLTGRGLGVKERTVISIIDYMTLPEQTWATASVRKKLKILFVFFEHLDDTPKQLFPVRGVLLWEPDARTNALLRADWQRVFVKVRQARAHELSESDGVIMGPCTKGATGESLRPQPFGTIKAKPRAWALKPSFTGQLFRAMTKPLRAESLLDDLGLSGSERFEESLIERFTPYIGRTVDDVAAGFGMPPSSSKSYAAAVARRIFGAKGFRTKILEFEEMGLTPRTTRVGDDLMPYEAASFPTFRYGALLEEEWEDSDLLARVEYMLFLPVHGRTKSTHQGSCTFARPVFWRPTTSDLELIRREWELYRLEIRQGWADHLTPASGTRAIHVRPHGRKAVDVDVAPIVGPVTKKCFWLNKPFIRDILVEGTKRNG